MKKFLLLSTTIFLTLLLATSCNNDVTETEQFRYWTPDEWATLQASPIDLPPTLYNYQADGFESGIPGFNIKATLGMVLFYDKNLSDDGTISCASCHKQELGFGDDLSLSKGVNGNETDRNSIAIGSLLSFGQTYGSSADHGGPGLFWDERAASVHDQIKETLENEKEMGFDLDRLSDMVLSQDYYQVLFNRVFEVSTFHPSDESHIVGEFAIEALVSFVNSLNTHNTFYDRAADHAFGKGLYAHSDWPKYNALENKGKNLFISNCSSCHGSTTPHLITEINFGRKSIANNGLPVLKNDIGRGHITGLEEDFGKFKIPGLRNIALSAPYMHDGRFKDLHEVIDFYNSGIADHDNLHFDLQGEDGKPIRMNFTESDKESIVAFLQTLTDDEMSTKAKWSDPFME